MLGMATDSRTLPDLPNRGAELARNGERRNRNARWPDDETLVSAMAEERTYAAVARRFGRSRESLSAFLRFRPMLRARMAEHERTPEERAARRRQQVRDGSRTYRERHPEAARARTRDYQRRRRLDHDHDAAAYGAILSADPCSYCGGPAGTVDHVVPLSRGGRNDAENLTAACFDCNRSKGARPLLIHLLKRG